MLIPLSSFTHTHTHTGVSSNGLWGRVFTRVRREGRNFIPHYNVQLWVQHTHTQTNTHTNTNTHTHKHIHTNTHTRKHTHTLTWMVVVSRWHSPSTEWALWACERHVYMSEEKREGISESFHITMYNCEYKTHTHTQTHTHIHTQTNTRKHTQTHTHTHKHIHTLTRMVVVSRCHSPSTEWALWACERHCLHVWGEREGISFHITMYNCEYNTHAHTHTHTHSHEWWWCPGAIHNHRSEP